MNYKTFVVSVLAAAVVAAGVAAWLGGGKLLGGVRTVPDEYPNGVKIGNRTFNNDNTRVALDQGVNQAAIRNTSGKDRYMYNAVATLNASTTATNARVNSSFVIDVGTSSSATMINYEVDYARPTTTPVSIFPSIAVGTSTQVRNHLPLSNRSFVIELATTSLSDGATSQSDQKPDISYIDAGPLLSGNVLTAKNQAASRDIIEWRDGEYIVIVISPMFYDNRCGGTAAAICKTATSTLLGIDSIDLDVDYWTYD